MGVEIAESEMANVSVDSVVENGKLNKEPRPKESINFGTHVEEPVKAEGNDVSDANFPKNAVDEWPAVKQIHSFYFVRYRPFEDPKLKDKINYADKEITKKNKSRFQITEELKAKRSERAELISQLKILNGERKQYTAILDEKKKEMEPLQQALGKLRNTNSTGRGGLCSSEEELNDLINALQYRIQHEIIPLTEEKQILREIKQLEGTREKVIANAAMRAKIQESLGQKDAIQDQVKLIGVDLDGVRKERQAVWAKINQLEEKTKALDDEIKTLQDELAAVIEKRDQAFSTIQELRKLRDEGNSHFYQSRATLNKARELAALKDIKALEDLACTEVEKFMSSWNIDKKFRDDYEKRIFPSLDQRLLSRDGRMRNPDEKPLIVSETPEPSEPEPVAKASVKRLKEEPKSTPQKDSVATVPSKKVEKETSKTDSKSTNTTRTTTEHIKKGDENISSDKPEKNPPPVEKEIDEAKLKELKREEEIAKAKQAMERKKKLAEKAAAKAAIRAQKEAEKKLKEREKKLKKVAGGSAQATNPQEPAEAVTEAVEPENMEAAEEEPVPVSVLKKKGKRETTIKHRNRTKNVDSLPRAILKKKKSTNYWMWAAPAAVLLLVLLVLAYYYLL